MVMNLLGGEVTQMNKLTTEHLEDKCEEVHTQALFCLSLLQNVLAQILLGTKC